MRMLRATRDGAKQQYHQHLGKINEANRHLQETLSEEDYGTVTRVTDNSRENKYRKESNRLKEKFETLRGRDTNNER